MNPPFLWCPAFLRTLMVVSSWVLPAFAHPSLQDTLDQSCQQDLAAHAPQAHARHAAVGTVLQIDHHSGLLTLKTDIGWVQTFVAPETIQDLQIGDQILVCLAEAESSGQLPPETRGK
jgi:hypothetical protein